MNSFSFDDSKGEFEIHRHEEGGITDEVDQKETEIHGNLEVSKNLRPLQDEEKIMVATQSQANIIEFLPDMNTMLVVKAGPGSGKTNTLVKRIAYMITREKLKAEEILVLSMANRSVNSLKQNLISTIGKELSDRVSINTFHAFCGALVDQYGDQYSPSFKKKRLMDDLSWRSFSNIFLGKLININGKTVDGNLSAPSLERLLVSVKSGSLTIPQAAYKYKVSNEYIEALILYLEKNGMIRYHDLLTNALDLIKLSLKERSDGIVKLIPSLANYKAVIVDEFQDIHPLLLLVMKAVVQYPSLEFEQDTNKHLTMAGDPNQSIYEFLGSKPELIDNIQMEISGSTMTQLLIKETFRVTPEILTAVTQVCLQPNGLMGSLNQELKSVRNPGYTPVIRYHPSDKDEYAFIASEISRLICVLGGLLKPSDFVILTRSNKEIEEISKFLAQTYNFKCNKFSLSPLWLSSKMHILLDLLNVLSKGPGSDFGLLCVISLLDIKPGHGSRISKIFNLSNKWGDIMGIENSENLLEDYLRSELEALEFDASVGNCMIKKKSKSEAAITNVYKIPKYTDELILLKRLFDSIATIREKMFNDNQDYQDPPTILRSLLFILENLQLLKYINIPNLPKGTNKAGTELVNIEKHTTLLKSYLQSFNRSLKYSYECYNEQNLISKIEKLFVEYFLRNYNDEIPTMDRDMINISTVHTAKGLEFPVVFVAGVAKNYNAHSFWGSLLDDSNEKQEQGKARLLYVACTRARDLLYLGSAKPLNSLSTNVMNNFTTNLPSMNSIVSYDLNQTLLESLSQDLHREIPSKQKLNEGVRLFNEFSLLGLLHRKAANTIHVRLFHTYARTKSQFRKSIFRMNRILIRR